MIPSVLPTYSRAPLHFVKGEGTWLIEADGRRFLDMGAGIAVNALWPRTAIDTAALQMIPGIRPEHCRKPEIMADAAYLVLTSDAKRTTGNFFIDDEVLAQAGVDDLDQYSVVPGSKNLVPDLFL